MKAAGRKTYELLRLPTIRSLTHTLVEGTRRLIFRGPGLIPAITALTFAEASYAIQPHSLGLYGRDGLLFHHPNSVSFHAATETCSILS